jgi:phage terminase large subunit-like protein
LIARPKVIQFIETYCRVPEGKLVGKPIQLMKFQKDFIEDIYDNSAGTTRTYLLIARRNGKSSLIAAIALAHIVGPEAKQNTQIISGARSRDQASLVYKLAEKMVRLNPELRRARPACARRSTPGRARCSTRRGSA